MNWDSISFGNGDEPIKRVMMSEPLRGIEGPRRRAPRGLSSTAADLVQEPARLIGTRQRVGENMARDVNRSAREYDETIQWQRTRKNATTPALQRQAEARRKSRSPRPVATRTRAADAKGRSSKKMAKKGEELKEEMDSLVDEIDAVLEENAEEFVKNYVQRGGE